MSDCLWNMEHCLFWQSKLLSGTCLCCHHPPSGMGVSNKHILPYEVQSLLLLFTGLTAWVLHISLFTDLVCLYCIYVADIVHAPSETVWLVRLMRHGHVWFQYLNLLTELYEDKTSSQELQSWQFGGSPDIIPRKTVFNAHPYLYDIYNLLFFLSVHSKDLKQQWNRKWPIRFHIFHSLDGLNFFYFDQPIRFHSLIHIILLLLTDTRFCFTFLNLYQSIRFNT